MMVILHKNAFEIFTISERIFLKTLDRSDFRLYNIVKWGEMVENVLKCLEMGDIGDGNVLPRIPVFA